MLKYKIVLRLLERTFWLHSCGCGPRAKTHVILNTIAIVVRLACACPHSSTRKSLCANVSTTINSNFVCLSRVCTFEEAYCILRGVKHSRRPRQRKYLSMKMFYVKNQYGMECIGRIPTIVEGKQQEYAPRSTIRVV